MQKRPCFLSFLGIIVLAVWLPGFAFAQNEKTVPEWVSLQGIDKIKLGTPFDSIRHLLEPVPIPDYYSRAETAGQQNLDSLHNMSWPEGDTYLLNEKGRSMYASIWGAKVLNMEITLDVNHKKVEDLLIFFADEEHTNRHFIKKIKQLNKQYFHLYHPEPGNKHRFHASVIDTKGLPVSLSVYNYDGVGKILYDKYLMMRFRYITY